MAEFVSLVRGINVGGHAKMKMDDLKAAHEALGLEAVRTHLNSGNVIFRDEAGSPSRLAAKIAKEIKERLGTDAKIVVRSRAELRDVVARNPFRGDPAREPSRLAVMFLGSRPEDEAVKDLLANLPGPEDVHPRGEELYLYYPEGIGRSRLSNVFLEKKLGTYGTTRNWNTVTKLLELVEGLAV